MIDPGIGFGKTAEDNMRLLKHLSRFRSLGRPILTGVSRKSFIGKVISSEPADRLEGTAAAVAVAIMNGSSVVRVHDARIMKKIAVMTDAIVNA
jgi:dihydropteroate synthase